jgi:hypothetical protein
MPPGEQIIPLDILEQALSLQTGGETDESHSQYIECSTLRHPVAGFVSLVVLEEQAVKTSGSQPDSSALALQALLY